MKLKREGTEADPLRSSWGETWEDWAAAGLILEADGTVKVSSVVRQEVPEGEEPQDLPEPRGLEGVARRPVPLGRLQTRARRGLAEQFRELSELVMGELERAAIGELVAEDAAGYIRAGGGQKGPVGRGGRPLGPERISRINRVWNRQPMKIVADFLEDAIDDWAISMESFLEAGYLDLYNVGAKAGQRQIGVRPSFELRSPAVLEQLAKRANFLTGGVSQDTFNRLRTVIAEEFYLAGKNPLDVAGSLRSEFSWLEKTRSETIARTETLAVTSEATHTMYQASGVELKRWLTTLDGRERETHFEAHGQMVKIDELFEVGAAELMYPGDSTTGELGEIINCRCSTIPVILPDQQFSSGTVWDGSNAPDEFARERIEAA